MNTVKHGENYLWLFNKEYPCIIRKTLSVTISGKDKNGNQQNEMGSKLFIITKHGKAIKRWNVTLSLSSPKQVKKVVTTLLHKLEMYKLSKKVLK